MEKPNHKETEITHTHTDVHMKVISRNQAHAGLWPARAWFKKLQRALLGRSEIESLHLIARVR